MLKKDAKAKNISTQNKKKSKKKSKKIPKTVQQSIPYDSVYPNGIISLEPGIFSKSYKLEDANFKTEDEERQESLFLSYESILNSIDATMTAEVTIFNRNIDSDTIKNNILLKPQKDDLNVYREEYNDVLLSKMAEGKNNLVKEKYFTVSVEAENIDIASTIFKRLDTEISQKVERINTKQTPPLSTEDRLNILYDIYNPHSELPFKKKIESIMNFGKLDLAKLNRAGLTTKDLIGPDSMQFNKNYFIIGDTYGRSVFLDNLPTFLNTDILNDLSDLSCNMLSSVIYRPMQPDKAIKLIRNQTTNINENIIEAQKSAAKGNYSSDLIPSELKRAKEEADTLLNDVMTRNQKIFKTSIVITLFADTLEDLNQKTESLKSIAVGHLCQIKVLDLQQEYGFDTCLPLGRLHIGIDRVLTTESASVFIPFSVQELSQKNGIYYGQNALSKNLIMYDRSSSSNYNGLIFGKPGSGKSFIAKEEMLSVLLGTNDDVYVIDPEGEYTPIAELTGGQVLKIAIGTETYLNPLDMDIQYANKGENPVAMKCDFLVSICETIAGGKYGLTPIDISIIQRCGRELYKPYMEHMRQLASQGSKITCDKEAMPTLVNFYRLLLAQPEAEAQRLAMALEIYCTGNYDIFAHKTNVNVNSRMVVYNIKDIGSGMKELGLQICLNDVWNKIIDNRKLNKRTWFYIDEFYLLTQTESSARFLQQIYKRARKWNGVPTGITQNVEDLLTSPEARGIINNCNFILMLNQSPIDRNELASMFSLSPSLTDYITDKPAGTGLLYNGKTTVPFINEFPADTKLYKIMSTKPKED